MTKIIKILIIINLVIEILAKLIGFLKNID